MTNATQTRFGITAATRGGSMGARTAWVKEDGARLEFATEDEARAAARKLNNARSMYGPALTSYVARQIKGA
jgi:hypothetical protein